ncbi:MAG: helix-turn-helix domain-containing protein [Candidatus Binataceae bacterium]
MPPMHQPSISVDELLADPSRAKDLIVESVPELLTQVASRVASLHTLEGALLALIVSQRIANGGAKHDSSLLSAGELAKRFGVPETWVREQARFGNLPYIRLGHYVRFSLEEAERFLAARANKAA